MQSKQHELLLKATLEKNGKEGQSVQSQLNHYCFCFENLRSALFAVLLPTWWRGRGDPHLKYLSQEAGAIPPSQISQGAEETPPSQVSIQGVWEQTEFIGGLKKSPSRQ